MDDRWYTPRWLLDPLGNFDLDPANSEPDKFPTAIKHYTENGLLQFWHGRVWLNPPFSDARPWVERLIEHGNGIALVFFRSDAVWFQHAIEAASGILMLKGRVEFIRPNGKGSRCPLGCVLLAFGQDNAEILQQSKLSGIFLQCLSSAH